LLVVVGGGRLARREPLLRPERALPRPAQDVARAEDNVLREFVSLARTISTTTRDENLTQPVASDEVLATPGGIQLFDGRRADLTPFITRLESFAGP
jgi:hypothetical protein